MPQLIQNIRNSIEVLLAIKNDPGGSEFQNMESERTDEYAGLNIGTPSSGPVIQSPPFKPKARQQSKRTLQDRKMALYGKKVSEYESQSALMSNFNSGKLSTCFKHIVSGGLPGRSS